MKKKICGICNKEMEYVEGWRCRGCNTLISTHKRKVIITARNGEKVVIIQKDCPHYDYMECTHQYPTCEECMKAERNWEQKWKDAMKKVRR